MQIFLARNNKQAGPYTLEQLNTMLTSGQVQLSDLAWHEGMENWKKLGDITGGQLYYTGTPSTSILPTATDNQSIQSTNTYQHGFNAKSSDDLKLAEVGTRIGAKVIDQLLLLICLLPAIPYVSVDIKGLEKLQTNQEVMAFYQKIFEGLPTTVAGFISIAYLCLIFFQLFLLAKKGQTIGKLMLGIRIVDNESNKLPSLLNVVALRTLLTETLYMLAFPLLIIIDTIAMFVSPENRSLHDRLARTKVLVAHDDQLTKADATNK